MANATWLGFENWVDVDAEGVTWETAAPSVGDLTPEKLSLAMSDDVWRVTEIADHASGGATELSLTLPADRPVDVVSAQFPRGTYPGVNDREPSFGAADTIRVQLYAADGAVVHDSGANASAIVPGYMLWCYRLPAPVSARRAVFTFAAASRVDRGFFDVSSLGLWPVRNPEIGLAYPADAGWIRADLTQRTASGRVYSTRYDPRRAWSLVFDALTTDDADWIDELSRYAGGGRQILAKRCDLPAGRDCMLARLVNDVALGWVSPSRRQASLSLEEFI